MMATGVLSEVPQLSIKIVFSSAERLRITSGASETTGRRLVDAGC